jgi:hypothetical protein
MGEFMAVAIGEERREEDECSSEADVVAVMPAMMRVRAGSMIFDRSAGENRGA